ncbi:MAG: hypothetical protein RL757_571 [Bacteroidota bacterium]|jgi:O-antigen/teichoic acid export membrane protein
MVLSKNVVVNYIATFWNMVANFLFIPFYISFLNPDAFGVISYAATLQAFLMLSDLGISATLKRELASAAPMKDKRDLFVSIERIFGIIIGLITIIFAIILPIYTDQILNRGSLGFDETANALRLMIPLITGQLFFSLYFGALWGMGKTVEANIFQILFSVFKNGGVIAAMYFLSNDMNTFLQYQIIITILFILLIRFFAYKNLFSTQKEANFDSNILDTDADTGGVFNWEKVKSILPYAGGLFAISLIAAVNYQMDKIILSQRLPIENLGYYSLAFTLSQAAGILTNPMIGVFFPQITYFSDTKNQVALGEIFKKLTIGTLILGGGIFALLWTYSADLIWIWTGKEKANDVGKSILPVILIGGFLQSLQIIFYNFLIANKNTSVNTIMGISILVFSIPLYSYMIGQFGILGAGYSWLIYNLVSTPIFIGITFKKYFDRKTAFEYLKNLVVILTIFLSIFSASHYIFHNILGIRINLFSMLCTGGVAGLTCLGIIHRFYFRFTNFITSSI